MATGGLFFAAREEVHFAQALHRRHVPEPCSGKAQAQQCCTEELVLASLIYHARELQAKMVALKGAR